MYSKNLKPEEMKETVGGAVLGGSIAYDEKHCAKNNNGPHEDVKTGTEDEEPFFVLRSRHRKEYRCIHCGRTVWEYED